MASIVRLLVQVGALEARRALDDVERRARAMGRSVERSAHRMADRGEDAWRRIRQGATRALAVVGNFATRGLSMLADGLMEAARSAGTLGLKLGAALKVMLPLVATVGNLLGLLILIPGAIATAGAAMAVLKMGFHGVSDALQAGLEGDTKKFEAALKKLAPEAQDTVKHLVFLAGGFRVLRKEIQNKLFYEVDHALQRMNDAHFPALRKHLPAIAGHFNRAFRETAHWLAEAKQSAQVDGILNNISGTIANISRVFRPLVQTFLDFVEVGTGKTFDLTRGLGEGAENLAKWARNAKESGKMNEWLDKALDTVKQLMRIAGNVGESLAAIWKNGQDDSKTMLDGLEKGTQKLAEFLNSKRGEDFLNMMGLITDVLVWMAEQAAILSAVWSGWFAGMKELWKGLALWALDSLGQIINGLVAVFGKVPGIGPILKEAQAAFRRFAQSVTADLLSIPNRTVFVNVQYRQTGRAVQGSSDYDYSSGIGGQAAGGPSRGGWTWVGERGRELLKLPPGAMVGSNGGSGARAASVGASRSDTGPTAVSLSLEGTSDPLLRELLKMLRAEIRQRFSGNVQSALGQT